MYEINKTGDLQTRLVPSCVVVLEMVIDLLHSHTSVRWFRVQVQGSVIWMEKNSAVLVGWSLAGPGIVEPTEVVNIRVYEADLDP